MSAEALLAAGHAVLLRAGLPADVQEIPPADQTSPGLLGFLVTFAVAAAVIALAFSLVRHLRVVDRNARRLQAEQDAARAASAVDQDGSADGAGSSQDDAGPTSGPPPTDPR